MHSNKSFVRLVIVVALIVMLIGLLAFDGRPTSASPLRQIITPPTSAPTTPPPTTPPPTTPPPTTPPPLTTPPLTVPPSNTPGGSPATSVPVPPPPAKKGGGGGAPPGPSGTPTVNGCVLSIGRDGVGLSAAPGFYQAFIQSAPRGDILRVLQGPERVDTIWWWRLRTATGVEGWGSQDNITPDPGPCDYGVSAAAAAVQPLSAGQTPAPGGALPNTGNDGLGWVLLAGLLAAVLIVAATWRRMLQAQPAGQARLPDDKDDPQSRP